jgi:ferredoxin
VLCAATAPDLFDQDEHGYAAVATEFVPPELVTAARAAAAACPEEAIEIHR